MKKEDSVRNVVDVIGGLLQSIILAIIPIVLEKQTKWQIVAYLAVVIIYFVFLCLFREKLINRIILSSKINVDELKEESLVETFKGKIVPNSFEIKNFKDLQDEKADEYYLFIRWKETAELIILYFTPEFINQKLIRRKETSYSNRKIYEKDIQIVVDILIQTYDLNEKFKEVISDYKCRTLNQEIKTLYDKLVNIKNHII